MRERDLDPRSARRLIFQGTVDENYHQNKLK
jgi:hypothetical protein